jgi:hypothetical protein
VVADVLTILVSQRQAAVAALTAAAGDLNLCAMSRSGKPYPAVKYHEGAVAALAEAKRAVGDQLPDGSVEKTLAGLRAGWQAKASTPIAEAPGWQAYYAGGIEALDAVLGQLHGGQLHGGQLHGGQLHGGQLHGGASSAD